ncbi:hypothetical protein HHI36_000870 [Cryptolaemus montrouzieri]|uniref:AAA+ ATPase domain-containing protein n=1 Tax=Cryptolaemus montrouzieri TaxID=559131 RepID=A0ABD2P5T8_9CUCU
MAEYSKRRSGSLSIASQEKRKRDNQDRKNAILYLILDYLKTNNLITSYDTLKREAQMSEQITVCDNVDLDIILQEFQSYYHMKFQRDPRIIRKVSTDEQSNSISQIQKTRSAGRVRTIPSTDVVEEKEKTNTVEDEFRFEIVSLESQENVTTVGTRRRSSQISDQERKRRLSDYSGYTPEWREMADQILKEFIPKTLGVTWGDCIGLDKPIELLKEATIYPLQYPELFEGIPSSWNGILLYGPPGTGKTLLAKALACESDSIFINVTSSAFVSKWRGDSEKMIKVTFDLAKYYAPCTIFIDEIDALLSETKETNHEATCRFRSELLTQMDGLLSTTSSVFVLATTNSPWKLDKALLRRFEKRILICLPNEEAKVQLFKHYANWKNDSRKDLINLTQLTENFSGSDIKNVCKEMKMRLVREQLKEMRSNKKIGQPRNPTLDDLISAVKCAKPSNTQEYCSKIISWHEQYGSI